jgi:RNA-binding protein
MNEPSSSAAAAAPALTTLERRNLKAHAHHLDPVVMIGNDGLTDAVLAAIDAQLQAHELIKVRVFDDDRVARKALAERIVAALGAALVQQIGKLVVLYRPLPSGGKIDPSVAYGTEAPVEKAAPRRKAPAAHLAKKLAAAGKTVAKRKPRKTVEDAAGERDRPSRIAQENRSAVRRSTRRGARRSR